MRDMDMEGIYRAKRRDGGGWVEGYFYLDGNKTPCISSFLCDDKSDCTLELEIDPTTLCRHADMKDRNGTPIFENDLIQITGKGERLVEWSTENLGWTYSEKPYDDYDGYLSEIPRRNITVIGNLFYRAGNDAVKKRMYVDKQGRKYRVMGGIGPDTFKARVQAADKHGETGWRGVSFLPWRKSFPEAQRDLDEIAAKKKWSVWYGEG